MCGALWNTLTVLGTSQTEPHLFTRPISTPRCSHRQNHHAWLQRPTFQLQTWWWQFPKRKDIVPPHGGTTHPDSWFTARFAAGSRTAKGLAITSSFFFLWRVRKIVQSNLYLPHVCPPVHPSVWNNWTDFHEIWYWGVFLIWYWSVFWKFDIGVFFENLLRKFKFH
jgi:hypothetical protein